MSEWIKFSEQRPHSFQDIIYCYYHKYKKSRIVSVGWIESYRDEEFAVWDIHQFTIYQDDDPDNEYKLLVWMHLPNAPEGGNE